MEEAVGQLDAAIKEVDDKISKARTDIGTHTTHREELKKVKAEIMISPKAAEAKQLGEGWLAAEKAQEEKLQKEKAEKEKSGKDLAERDARFKALQGESRGRGSYS